MGSQVNEKKNKERKFKPCHHEEHFIRFWLKEIARWDLRLTKEKEEKKTQRERERKKERRGRK
jgi:hypothetical protein